MQTNRSICDVRNLSDPGLQWKAWEQDWSERMTVTLYWPIGFFFVTFHPRRRRSAHCPGLVECFSVSCNVGDPAFPVIHQTLRNQRAFSTFQNLGVFSNKRPSCRGEREPSGGSGRDRAAHADATQSFQLKERRRVLVVKALERSPVFTLKNDKNVPLHSSKYARYICKFFSGQRPLHLVCKQLLDLLLHYVLWHFQTFWNCTSSPRKDFYWRAHGKSNSRTLKIPTLFHWRKSDSRFQRPNPMKQRRKCEILHERGLGLSRCCSAEQNRSVRSSWALLRLFLFPFPKSWNMYRNNSMFCPGTKIVGWEHSGSSRTYRNLVISSVLRYLHRRGIQGSFPHLNYSRRCQASPLPFLARPFLVKAQLNPPVPQTLEKPNQRICSIPNLVELVHSVET